MGKNATAQMEREQRATIDSCIAYQGEVFRVRHDTITESSSPSKHWDIVCHSGAVAIIPMLDRDHVILIEQWRRAIDAVSLEIPAGALEKGEPPLECAQRELQEETGYKALELIHFGGCHSAPGFSNEYVHFFIGRQLIEAPLQADDTDLIDVRIVPFVEAIAMIQAGHITDAKTVSALLRYKVSL